MPADDPVCAWTGTLAGTLVNASAAAVAAAMTREAGLVGRTLLGVRAAIMRGELSGPCAGLASYGSIKFRSTRRKRTLGHHPASKKSAEYGISGAESQTAEPHLHAHL